MELGRTPNRLTLAHGVKYHIPILFICCLRLLVDIGENVCSMKNLKRIETKLIHSGEPEPRVMGAVSLPIFQTAMYEYGGEESYQDIRYIRLNNSPNHRALHQKVAALENAEAALVAASGMAAI